jgi:LPXTG-motif cell wall-anchored protein
VEYGGAGVDLWLPATIKLTLAGIALLALAAWLFRRRFAQGARA